MLKYIAAHFMPHLIITALVFTLFFTAAHPALAQNEDEDIDRAEKMMETTQKDLNDKINKELKNHGVQIQGAEGVSEVMKQIQKASGADDESASSWVYWFFIVFISITGMGYFSAGKRNEDVYFMASGAIMMVYPYFVSGTFLLVSVGILLTVMPFIMNYYSVKQ
ncbi:MAG TPA: hypothetical protein PKW98_18895 [Candidatus Wallbacteria bacterium]|nr:MAG: hypothetical protein BWY32_03077 [bacterium ADurb.Bin243]HPG59894.1 hypothetical protein [Candidatus Wallbacteria bacterium]